LFAIKALESSSQSIEDFDFSAHSTPAALKITATNYKEKQTKQQEDENHVS
jgi:hypothetical protein